MSSLYEKYGGHEKISEVVRLFYKNLEKSNVIKPYFQGIELEPLLKFQIDFFSQQMGGPQMDPSKYQNTIHKLPIKDEDFLEVAEILENTLIAFGLESDDIESVLSLVANSRGN